MAKGTSIMESLANKTGTATGTLLKLKGGIEDVA
jgi:hypothetical protein